jgi:threonine dehydrogenase-like Zn-dependent dehydrogenase
VSGPHVGGRPGVRPHLPATEHAIRFVGPDRIVHDRAKPVPVPGPTQVLARVEAVGLCFSDTKLLHAFSGHLRKSEVLSGLPPEVLAEIPSYVPGELPTVPGHETACRIVAVGRDVKHHRVGERCLVQTDYRHLPTAGANAAFGYDFEGGLQEYVLMDERVIIEPGTGERFLIPVGEEPSASAVALLEPWACVEASYSYRPRRAPLAGGRMLVIAEPGHAIEGLAPLLAADPPREVVSSLAERGQAAALSAALGGRRTARPAEDTASLPAGAFDDILYFGADPDRLEAVQGLLAPGGVLDVVLAGRRVGRPVAVDVGRVHYDLVRWLGTPGPSAAEGYAIAPEDVELRDGERVAVIGAAGPMGFMHVIRALSLGRADVSVTAVDIDATRLAHLAAIAAPLAETRGVRFEALDSRTAPPRPGYSYVALMVPSPTLVEQTLELASEGGRINLFAGFAVGTRAPVDLDLLLGRRLYLLGTSGSLIPDMRAVLARLEAGTLDTNISVDAVGGLAGVAEALAAVEARTSGGKIVIYPELHELGLVRLSELHERFPGVAAALDGGRWTKAAEEALLATGTGSHG